MTLRRISPAGRSEPSEPVLQEYWRQGAEVQAMTQNFSRDTVTPTTTEDTAEAVVFKNFKTALILYAQGLGFTAVKQDSSDH